MKQLIFILLLITSILAQQNTTETIIDPLMLADNGMTFLILVMVGHIYKRNIGITSSCEGPKDNRTMKFAMQSSGSELNV